MNNISHRVFSTQAADQALWVAQISDTHLYANKDGRLLGLNTFDTLSQVLDSIQLLPRQPDVIIATGDLVHDASPEGYRLFADATLALGLPVLVLPGNHDQQLALSATLSPLGIQCCTSSVFGSWWIHLLDTSVPGREAGIVKDEDLSRLADIIEAHPKQFHLIATHHHPQSIHCPWLDRMGIDNGAQLMAMAHRLPQTRGLVFGHVHQAFATQVEQLQLLSAPSTCIQFSPGQDRFQLDASPPGYRLLALCADGQIHSKVFTLDSAPPGAFLDSDGYI